jgi:hypothetical protein
MLATAKIAVRALVESLRFTRGGAAFSWLRCAPAPISMRKPISASVIATAVKMPIAIWLVRQPSRSMPKFTSGGQIVPPI